MSSWTCSVCHQVNPMSTYRCRSCNHGNIVRTHNSNSRRKEDQKKGIYQEVCTVPEMLQLMRDSMKQKKEQKEKE